MASRVCLACEDLTVHLVSLVQRVHLVILVPEVLMALLADLVLLVPLVQWEAAVTGIKEREETRAMRVFLDPVVLPAMVH